MKRLLEITLLAFLAISCQIEDENAPKPEETFIKYFGELTSYKASDIEIVYDATGEVAEELVIFGVKTSSFGDDDFFVLRTDLDGNLIDSASYSFDENLGIDLSGDGNENVLRGNEIASQIQPIPGGGFILVGTTSLTETLLDISDWQLLTIAFVDNELNLLRERDSVLILPAINNNFELDLIGNDVIILDGGSLLIAGAREFDRGGGVTDFDNFFLKIDPNGSSGFLNTQGVAGDGQNDILVRAFEKTPGGNIVLIGHSNAPSLLGENNGNNGANVYFLEISSTGTPVNFAAYGFEDPDEGITAVYDEQVNNVIRTATGFSIVGTSTTSTDLNYSFVMNLSDNGLYLNGNSFTGSAFNSETNVLQSFGNGITQTQTNDLAVVGQYQSFVSGNLSRGGEGMFVKFDQASVPVAGAESFFGLADGNDSVVDAVTLPDGKIVAVANVDFGGGVQLISVIKLNDNGSLD